jgi:RNA polymerase sigma-B factor
LSYVTTCKYDDDITGPLTCGAPAAGKEPREILIEQHLPLVRALARRFARRGEDLDDLVQVGSIGLINAVDRFESSRGCPFEAYAVPCILGEIRRHLRDGCSVIRLPRRTQEQGAALARAERELMARLGRTPSARELAAQVGLPLDEVERAIAAMQVGSPAPLPNARAARDRAVAVDFRDRSDERMAVEAAMRALPERDRRVLRLRFELDLSQEEIARRVGVSQVQVSRLLRAALGRLRAALAGEQPVVATVPARSYSDRNGSHGASPGR